MWTFEQVQSAGLSGITHLLHDGRDVWAIAGNTIAVYSYIDEEYLAHEYQFDRGEFSLNLVATITNPSSISMAAYWNQRVYVVDAAGIRTYNTTTRTQVGSPVTLPATMQPFMAVAGNKLWMTTSEVNESTDCQELYYYDLIGNTWSAPILIPGKKQYVTRHIVDGFDGHIYITNTNDHAILKFTTSGAYVGQYRINRHPYFLHTNQYQQVYVVSDGQNDPMKGMVSVFDTSTNTSTNFAAAGGTIAYIADVVPSFVGDIEDPASLRTTALGTGKLVSIGGTPKMSILNKSDKKIKYASQNPESEDYVPGAALELNITPLRGLVTPSISFDVWNGSSFVTKTVNPYAFMATSTSLLAYRLSSLVRVNSMEVLGTAMIATGAQNYYGDL